MVSCLTYRSRLFDSNQTIPGLDIGFITPDIRMLMESFHSVFFPVKYPTHALESSQSGLGEK